MTVAAIGCSYISMNAATETQAPSETLTAQEIHFLRFTGWEFHKGTCKINWGHDIKLSLARRGYMIAEVLPWGVECYLTPKGLTAVWDAACDALQHLRPDTCPEFMARVAARIAGQLDVWVNGNYPAVCAEVDQT